ncbi:MAG: hypothetical protein FJ405_04610 [Verrucomicrobia bacterium]|nr:hypothetical protein [Verrucomicrobiota bacterium]
MNLISRGEAIARLESSQPVRTPAVQRHHNTLIQLLCIVLSLIPTIARAEWAHAFVSPTSQNLSALATRNTSNGVMVIAVGERGTVLAPTAPTSPQNNVWREPDSKTRSWLRDIDGSDRGWMAVGDQGTIVFSTTGLDWRRLPSPRQQDWTGVVRGSNSWILVSTRGDVVEINDRLTVNVLPELTSSGAYLTCVRQGGGLYVAGGAKGALFTSADLITWQDQTLPTQDTISRLVHADGRWVATAGLRLWTSTDGTSWTSIFPSVDTSLSSIAHVRGVPGRLPLWIAVGHNGTAFYSTNLSNWGRINSMLFPADLADVRYVNGVWMAVGKQGAFWLSSELQPYFRDAAALSRFWYTANLPAPGFDSRLYSDVLAMDSDGTNILAMGGPGKALRLRQGRFLSLDSTGISGWIASLRYGAGQWVAVGDNGGIYRSTNSSRWIASPLTYKHDEQEKGWVGTTANLSGVDYGNGAWICVGDGGMIRRSSNGGINWSRINSSEQDDLFDVRFFGGMWLAVGENELILQSNDGIAWQRVFYQEPFVDPASLGLTNRLFPIQWEACSIPTNAGPTVPVRYRQREFGSAFRSVAYGRRPGSCCYFGEWTVVELPAIAGNREPLFSALLRKRLAGSG